jgi:Arc/MetJ family transcription regulator
MSCLAAFLSKFPEFMSSKFFLPFSEFLSFGLAPFGLRTLALAFLTALLSAHGETNSIPALTNFPSALTNSSTNAPPVPTPPTRTPREFFNAGTRQLQAGKWREAETALQTAAPADNAVVQPGALYNLGHVRFEQGADILKKAPDGDSTRQRADAAADLGQSAIRAADAALASDQVDALVRAYLQGRGARKELKAAAEAVKKALTAYAGVLSRWQRSSGDFKSAHEMQPALTNAQFNAEVVDRRIAALVDQQQMMMQSGQCAGDKMDDLKKKLDQLKGKIPDGMLPKCTDGDEDEEDDGDKPREPKKEDGPGQERPAKRGLEIQITEEDALRLLESFQLDGNRKLPMGGNEQGKPVDRKGRDW